MNLRANEIASELRASATWDTALLKELCGLAGLSAEWESADGETFEAVAYTAAEKLGVDLVNGTD